MTKPFKKKQGFTNRSVWFCVAKPSTFTNLLQNKVLYGITTCPFLLLRTKQSFVSKSTQRFGRPLLFLQCFADLFTNQKFVLACDDRRSYKAELCMRGFVSVHAKKIVQSSYKTQLCMMQRQKALFSSKNILQVVNQVEKTINKKQLFLPKEIIVCAISGGQDSAFLVFCLLFLQPQIALKLKAVWCNHFWQTCSFHTTLHLTKCAVSLSYPVLYFLPLQSHASPFFYKKKVGCLLLKADPFAGSKKRFLQKNVLPPFPPFVKKNNKGHKRVVKIMSETRARNWRHTTTERSCTFYQSKTCVYGHTGSDRVETILFNLIRGSGSRGTACLPWKRRHSHFCYNRFYPSYKRIVKSTHLYNC